MRTRRVGVMLGAMALVAVMAAPGAAREVSNSGDSGLMVSASLNEDGSSWAMITVSDNGWSWAEVHWDSEGCSIHGWQADGVDGEVLVDPLTGKDKLTSGYGSTIVYAYADCGVFSGEGRLALEIDLDGSDGAIGKGRDARSGAFPGSENWNERYSETYRTATGDVILTQVDEFGANWAWYDVAGQIVDWSASSHRNSH